MICVSAPLCPADGVDPACQSQNITYSIVAECHIAARYGKSQAVAATGSR